MSVECGSQCILCDLPIRFDTYKGCSHACKYCFVKRKTNISEIEAKKCYESLKKFINGKRSSNTNWCDWNIPLHWGGTSDPFQPVEAKYKISLNCLKIFAETKYPFVVSTKGKLLAAEEYLNILKNCNAVVQISMVCSKFDKLEKGAPTYQERLEMCRKISPNCKRLIVRIQPYLHEVLDDILNNLPRLKKCGVYGITIEGMKFAKKKKGMVKVGGDFCYPISILKKDYQIIKDRCHKLGLAFYCAENRLRTMGDGMCCCGVNGLEEFKTNEFNLCHIINGDRVEPTEQMKKEKTASCFKAIKQTTIGAKFYGNVKFSDAMIYQYKNNPELINKIFGKE